MAKIIKVGSQNPTFTSQNANLAKTARQNHTNPFQFSNFEGNTLQFADVFEGFKPTFKANPANKLRMVASSVTGSMDKMKSSISESVINFVNRVRGGISNAWEFTTNKPLFYLPGEIAFKNFMTAERHLPSINLSEIGKGISSKIESVSQDATNIGKDMSAKWHDLIAKINPKKYTADTPVSELEQAWRAELALDGGIA